MLKIEKFSLKNFDIFLIFVQNIDCRYTLEPPSFSVFWSKNKKKMVYPCIPQFYLMKVGYKGVFITRMFSLWRTIMSSNLV